MRRGNALVIILVILVIAGAAVFLIMQSPAGLLANVPNYKQMHDQASGQATGAKPERPVVVIDYELSKLDTLHGRLPSGLKATNDGEVKSVVIVERFSTGVPGATVSGLAVASANKGSYSISAFIYDKNGTLLQSQSASRESAMSGAGFEAELRPQVEQEILDWLLTQLQ